MANDEEILKNSKVFNDPIHGTVLLHPLLVNIIDTPQFQRLRYMKQLGAGYFVYPGASHNRFEHSIGVAHLAGLLIKALQTSQPELKIRKQDVLCVQIAGLCHDMGHGPFSHQFETFICKTHPGWKHEDASLQMFDHMVKSNGLKERMKLYCLNIEEEDDPQRPSDVTFIKEMIKGEALEGPPRSFKGRSGPDQRFFYDIVANKRNGIDVDKFDYLARDAHHLGIKAGFDHLRFINFARVCKVKKNHQICTRDKEVDNLYDLFHLRYLLHQRACQHKVKNAIESMIVEALEKADGHIQIEGSDKSLSEAVNDMEAYTKLTDHVYEQILHSTDDDLAEARELLERIVSRQHYRFLGETKVSESMKDKMKSHDVEAMKLGWKDELARACRIDRLPAEVNDFDVQIVKMDYGMKDKDPIKNMGFYSKSDLETGVLLTNDQAMFKPTYFSEQLIRAYWKKIDETSQKIDKTSLRRVRGCVSKLCREKKWPREN